MRKYASMYNLKTLSDCLIAFGMNGFMIKNDKPFKVTEPLKHMKNQCDGYKHIQAQALYT